MDQDDLAQRFEQERPRLRSVAYRILGTLTDADDAVQEAWMRLQRTDVAENDLIEAWLTTVVAGICLYFLRAPRRRTEESLDTFRVKPIVSSYLGENPE